VGACGGAAAGAWLLELGSGQKMDRSIRSGVGAGIGRLAGTAIKFGIGVIVWIVIAIAAFWP
jgi:hypothetical protein